MHNILFLSGSYRTTEWIGEMSERSKEAVLKTVEAQVSGGSNPSLSVLTYIWRGAREAESGSLLRS